MIDENLWIRANSSEVPTILLLSLHLLVAYYFPIPLAHSLSLLQKAYADLGDLEARIDSMLSFIRRKNILQKQQQQQQRACPPASSVAMMSVSSHPLRTSTNNNFAGATFHSANNIHGGLIQLYSPL